MFRQYYFSDGSDRSKPHRYVGLGLIIVILAWKLLRGISPNPLLWYCHVYALLILAAGSGLLLAQNHFRVRTFDMSLAVFIFCSIAVVRIVAFGNYRDPFTVATLAFFGHLVLASLFTKVSDREFFHGVSFVFAGLALIEILGIVEYTFDWGIVDYAGMERFEGIAPIEGAYAGRSFILFFFDFEVLEQFFGRLSGVSGTPYATAGLMSAITAFGLASRRWLLAALGVTSLLLSSTGSAVVALYISAALLYRRTFVMYVALFALLPFLFWVFELKGFTLETIRDKFLPVSTEAPGFRLLVAAIIGEGQHVGSIETELRIISLMFSLGLVGLLSVPAIFNGWVRGLRLANDAEVRRDYVATAYFVFTLFVSSIHYPTLFIYPNIVIVVVFLAVISSRLRLSRAAVNVRPGTAIAV